MLTEKNCDDLLPDCEKSFDLDNFNDGYHLESHGRAEETENFAQVHSQRRNVRGRNSIIFGEIVIVEHG